MSNIVTVSSASKGRTTPSLDDRLVTWTELKNIIPYSRSHIYALEKRGLFPRRMMIGANRTVWSLQEVQAWIEAKKNARH